MKHLHIDRTPHESRLHKVLYGHFKDGLLLLLFLLFLLLLLLLLLFVSRFLVFYKSLTCKSTTSWHHTFFYEALIFADIYATLQKASN